MTTSFRLAQQALRFIGEAAWLYCWSAVLGHWLDPTIGSALPLTMIAGYLLISATLGAEVAGRRRVEARVGITVSILGLVAAVGGGVAVGGTADPDALLRTAAGSRALLASSVALAAWWRGSRIGANQPTLDEVEGEFRFGVLALASLLALTTALGPTSAPEPAALVQPALVLVASGLFGVPLARIAEISSGARADTPKLTPSGPWLATLLGVVGGLLLLTLLLAGIFSVERVAALIGLVLSTISRVLWVLVMIVAVPTGYLVEWLVNLLRGAVTGEPLEVTPQSPPPIEELLRDPGARGQIPPAFEAFLDVMLLLSIAAVIVILLSRALLRRREWVAADGVEELRESVLGWEVIREMISQALDWLLRRRRSVNAALASAPADEVEPRSIRDVYREFLRLTARLGFPRARSETPLEYARRLERDRLEETADEGRQAPAGHAELDGLTSSYVRTRYGPPEKAPADPSPAARALERLRALWTRRG